MKGVLQRSLVNQEAPAGPLSRLDPRCLLISLLTLLVCLLSHGKYEVLALLPYALFPLLLTAGGSADRGTILVRLLVMLPFALLVGLFNPLIDKSPQPTPLGVTLPGGWLSFAAILVRFLISLWAALALVSVISYSRLCQGLRRLGLPAPLVAVLLFLGRYLHLLCREGLRIKRAREARAAGRLTWRSAGGALGSLFLRTLERADRIRLAMAARGGDGTLPVLEPLRWRQLDTAFTLLAVAGALGWRFLTLGWST